MYITTKDWKNYIDKLSKLSEAASDAMMDYVRKNGFADTNALIEYAYKVANTYGNGASALSAEMYDLVSELSGMFYPPAEMADEIPMEDVAKTINGIRKMSNSIEMLAKGIGRLVKRSGADTTLNNAIRDGAEFAWVPNGDTCAFCIALASRGWQPASKAALKKGHAEHIHANCDCTYAIRFDENTNVAGYDPERYREMYYGADGSSPKERINSLRRMKYEQNKDRINAQKREAYARRRDTEGQLRLEASNPFKNLTTPLSISTYDQSKHIRGGQRYNQYMENHEYEPSILTISENEIQNLVDKYHGTGILKLDRNGNIIPNEMIVDNDQVIGYVVNNLNGVREETTGFKIHYSSKGTHIVPMYESQKKYWKSMRDKNGNDWLLRQKS